MMIDGTLGEGGGQILRSSLALAAVTGRPFVIERIRGKRPKPGLQRQHLTCVKAIAEVCHAQVQGAELGSQRIAFTPGTVRHGDYAFAIGTAGSTSLVLQTVLPALLMTEGRSRIVLRGGTHNPMAPSFDFLAHAFFPLLHRMGVGVRAELVQHGFYPAGGGEVVFEVAGTTQLRTLSLTTRTLRAIDVHVVLSDVPDHVGAREATTLCNALLDMQVHSRVSHVSSAGSGNVITATLRSDELTEVFTMLGEIGVRAENIANRLAGQIRKYIEAEVPVGEHLADQLLIPMALAGAGRIRTTRPTLHTETNAAIIERFLPVRMTMHDHGKDGWLIDVTRQ